jgi:hypothetical protein
MLCLLDLLYFELNGARGWKKHAFTACHSKLSLSPITLAFFHCFNFSLLVVKLHIFRFLEGKDRPTCHLRIFPTCMILFSTSMMYSLLYEPNGGSVMLGFCVFLIFSSVCKCGVMALCDDCKMLEIERKVMGIIKLRVGCFLGPCSFMMGLCGIISNSSEICLWVDD